jgi:hypothetical protein
MWYFGTGVNIPVPPPSNWGLCNGSNYTGTYGTIKSPNLSDKFILGSSGSDIGNVGGFPDPVVPEHSHDVYDHYHQYDDRVGTQDYASLGGGNDAYRKQGYTSSGQFNTGGAVIQGGTTLVKPFGVVITGNKYNYPPYLILAYYIRYDD